MEWMKKKGCWVGEAMRILKKVDRFKYFIISY